MTTTIIEKIRTEDGGELILPPCKERVEAARIVEALRIRRISPHEAVEAIVRLAIDRGNDEEDAGD
jgi:hypothetical protein